MVTIRDFTDQDYAALAEVHNLVWGEQRTVEDIRAEDADFPSQSFRARSVVEVDGTAVAFGSASETPWAYAPHKYFIKCVVHPHYQGRGIGSAWYAHVSRGLRARGATLLTATTRDDKPAAIRFLERRGFVTVIREPESRIDLAAFDARRFAGVLERVASSGIRVTDLAALKRSDPDWARKCWDLEWAIWQDVPTNEVFSRESFEAFKKRVSARSYDRRGHFVAIDGATGACVGTSAVEWRDDDAMDFGLTGVRREHRRRGIALALKVQAIAYAKRSGATLLISDNEENNPMYALNQQLGFRYQWTWLGFENRLT
jgi:GNAT superfamily N-acetyltransferase